MNKPNSNGLQVTAQETNTPMLLAQTHKFK